MRRRGEMYVNSIAQHGLFLSLHFSPCYFCAREFQCQMSCALTYPDEPSRKIARVLLLLRAGFFFFSKRWIRLRRYITSVRKYPSFGLQGEGERVIGRKKKMQERIGGGDTIEFRYNGIFYRKFHIVFNSQLRKQFREETFQIFVRCGFEANLFWILHSRCKILEIEF